MTRGSNVEWQCRVCGRLYDRPSGQTPQEQATPLALPGWRRDVCPARPCQGQALEHARAECRRSQEAVRRAQLPQDRLPVAFLPANRTATARLPEYRRRAFAQHLANIAVPDSPRGAHTARAPAHDAPPLQHPPETVALIVLGCSTCKGHCCKTGGTHAWLTANTLQRVRQAHPQESRETLHARYLRQLPARSVTGSCVYHTATGCALEPALRSDTCHRYLCDGLLTLLQLSRREPGQSLRLAAVEDSRVVRTRKVRTLG